MPKKQSTQAKLIAMSEGDNLRAKSSAPSSSFTQKMLFYPDRQVAAQIVGEQAKLTFDQDEGAELVKLELERDEMNDRYKNSCALRDQLEEKLRNTKRYVKYYTLHTEKQDERVSFSGWRKQDQISIVVLLISLGVAMVMGAANVYANLMASGEPIFLEKPSLALFLSLLVPTGSAALKFISNFFDYDKTKKRYALGIYILTALTLLTWSVCFAMNFAGVSGGLDLDALVEGDNGSGVLLVWTQLAAEILVAGALFLAAEDIWNKYQPELYTESLEYKNIESALKKHLTIHDDLREQRNKVHMRIHELTSKSQAGENESIAEFNAMKSRFNSMNNV